MTFISIEIQLSSEQIFAAVEKMSEGEFDSFVGKILQIRGKRQAPSIANAEAEHSH